MILIVNFGCWLVYICERFFAPFLDLTIRFWMARIFFKSGLTKIGTWNNTVDLFRYEYKVPIIDPEIAAFMATMTELTAPFLLVIGFMGRLSALAMFIMTLIIQFTYLDLMEHFYWMMLLGIIILRGPGLLSIDHLIRRKFCYRY